MVHSNADKLAECNPCEDLIFDSDRDGNQSTENADGETGNPDNVELVHGSGNKPWHGYDENDEYVHQLLGAYDTNSLDNVLPIS